VTAFSRDRDALISAIDSHKASLAGKLNRGAMVEQLSASLSALQQMALFSRGNQGSKQVISLIISTMVAHRCILMTG
jgi:hypothetical protein